MKTSPLLAALCLVLGLMSSARAANSTETVVASYVAALGRYPTDEELKYWREVPKQSLERLISDNIMWASDVSRRAEYRATVVNSYCTVFGRAPRKDEIEYWTKRMPQPFRDLINTHLEFLTENESVREEVISRSLRVVYGQPADPSAVAYWKAQPVIPFVKLIAAHIAWKNSGRIEPTGAKDKSVLPAAPEALLIANTKQILSLGNDALVSGSGGKIHAAPFSANSQLVIQQMMSANAAALVTDSERD